MAPIHDPEEVINIKLLFEDQSIGNIDFMPDWVKKLWASPTSELDVTVIELSEIAIQILSRTRYSCLSHAAPQLKLNVHVFQFPGGVLKSGDGYIDEIDAHTGVMKCIVDAEPGSSGSPLLNSENKAVGIHCGEWQLDPADSQLLRNKRKKAIDIGKIFAAYKNELSNQYPLNLYPRTFSRDQSCVCAVVYEYPGNFRKEQSALC